MKNRINLIASLALNSKIVVDVGCDHGYTLLEILNKSINIEYCYAVDINEKPLNNAKKTLSDKYNDKVNFILSNGLNKVNNNFDTLIISGMGGSLISQILENDKDKLKDKLLILEPQGNNNLVRRWLYCHGFNIINEVDIVENNKYYEIIVAKEEKTIKYDILDINFGPVLRKKRSEYFINHYKKYYNLLSNIPNKTYQVKEKLIELDYILNNKEFIKVYYNSGYYMELKINDSNKYFVVFPGGGYKFTSEREREIIGLYLNSIGYNALVFSYLEKPFDINMTYKDIACAINKYFINIKKYELYYIGFSAGAHLALELGNNYDLYKTNVKGLVLAYPLVLSNYSSIEINLYKNLIPNLSKDDLIKLDQTRNVNKNAIPSFLFTTLNDELLNIKHTLSLLEAYQKHNLDIESHIFSYGKHGLSLANKDTALSQNDINQNVSMWFNYLIDWLKRH